MLSLCVTDDLSHTHLDKPLDNSAFNLQTDIAPVERIYSVLAEHGKKILGGFIPELPVAKVLFCHLTSLSRHFTVEHVGDDVGQGSYHIRVAANVNLSIVNRENREIFTLSPRLVDENLVACLKPSSLSQGHVLQSNLPELWFGWARVTLKDVGDELMADPACLAKHPLLTLRRVPGDHLAATSRAIHNVGYFNHSSRHNPSPSPLKLTTPGFHLWTRVRPHVARVDGKAPSPAQLYPSSPAPRDAPGPTPPRVGTFSATGALDLGSYAWPYQAAFPVAWQAMQSSLWGY